MGYLDGIIKCPPTPAVASSSITIVHYAHWLRQGQLLLNAIFSYVLEIVMPFIAMSSTSHDAWQHLAYLFARKYRVHIMSLKEDLTLIQRGSRMVSEFL